jgi:hypothetical protein
MLLAYLEVRAENEALRARRSEIHRIEQTVEALGAP